MTEGKVCEKFVVDRGACPLSKCHSDQILVSAKISRSWDMILRFGYGHTSSLSSGPILSGDSVSEHTG